MQLTNPANGGDEKFEGRQVPRLRELDHHLSYVVVQRMLPGNDVKQIADLSHLQVLRMCPEDKDNMKLAQPILDEAHETLEMIVLLHPFVTSGSDSEGTRLPFAPISA